MPLFLLQATVYHGKKLEGLAGLYNPIYKAYRNGWVPVFDGIKRMLGCFIRKILPD